MFIRLDNLFKEREKEKVKQRRIKREGQTGNEYSKD
jgi:hypothetical protein